MARTLTQIKRFRVGFGLIFLLSVPILFISMAGQYKAISVLIPSGGAGMGSATVSLDLSTIISVTSLLTSFTSLAGFFFTTTVAWRKERRDQENADVELEKKKLELQQLRRELEVPKEQDHATSKSRDGS